MMATLALCSHILFPAAHGRPQVEIRNPHSVVIEQSVTDLCQRATLTLPRNVSALQQEQLRTCIRRGDAVTVRLGYNGELNTEFEGFVERVGSDIPVVIDLRDGLWKLLQEPFNRSYRDVHVPTLVRDLVGSAFEVQAMEATIGPMRFLKTTKGEALKALKDNFGLVTYFKGRTVFCGVLFAADAGEASYDIERNVKGSNLKYRVADDLKLKVTAKGYPRGGGQPTEVHVGDEDGEQRTLSYYGITSEEELKKLAKVDMEKFKYDGYEGTLTGFGVPVCQFGDRVLIKSTLSPERSGAYVAESVKTTMSTEGFSREIKPAQQWTQSNA